MPDPIEELEHRTRFEPAEVEPRVTERWLASGLFHPEPKGSAADNYSIAIPPPNITGSLHMGHALNGAIQDVLIRYNRMRSLDWTNAQPTPRAKWILGTDHAGIATQAQVEKALKAEGTSRQEIGREAFERRVWEWREHYGHRIVEQFKRLGASCDYEEERFTLDEGYHRAVVKVFVDLYEQGLIYRDRYIVNWDPGSRSAISDLEVEERKETDTLYSIRYDLVGEDDKDRKDGEDGEAGRDRKAVKYRQDGDDGGDGHDVGSVTIATVRPETMLGDTAVAVNPRDERYRELVGRAAVLPLVGRHLPIVADEYVKMDFGTGQLKVTPAHDPNDFEIGQRHELEQVSVIGEDGRMTSEAGEHFAGLTVMEAREAVVAALREEGRIVEEEPYEHEVPYSHRSGERIEPLISLQWFMRMDELAKPAIEAVKSGAVRIVPDNHRRVYLDWMENIRPWCISRQLWWGHRLPVHYCETCNHVHVAAGAPTQCDKCGGELRQEEDVLDTWFSSALWPFATLGWPDETPELEAFYPTNVLSTARDILFLWVARMIMMGLRFTGSAPFSDVYIHTVIQAPDGRRMSKSLGTGIDPLEEIDRHGADAVRFGLLAMSSSQDVRYSAEKVQQGQALANKLFNAARFVLTRVADLGAGTVGIPGVQAGADSSQALPRPSAVEDRWILSRLQQIEADTAARIADYDFSHAALGLYDFVYGELCDWYLELVKHRLASDGIGKNGSGGSGLGERASGGSDLGGSGSGEGYLGKGASGEGASGEGDLGGSGSGEGYLGKGASGEGDLGGNGSGEAEEDRRALASILLHVLRETVAMCHPVIPFVTEELWSYLGGGDDVDGLLAGASYPLGDKTLIDPDAEVSMERAIEAITLIRGWRDSVGARPGLMVPARLNAKGYDATAAAVARLARLELSPSGDGDTSLASAPLASAASLASVASVASVSVPGGTLEILSEEGLDLGAAEHRRAAARERLEAEIGRVRVKLANEGFVAKAPEAVVEGERTKLAHLETELGAL